MEKFADELKTLGEYRSDDHDLALLRQRVLESVETAGDRTDLEALIALIDQRRGELQVEARRLGERVYVEKPRVFTGLLAACRSIGRPGVSLLVRQPVGDSAFASPYRMSPTQLSFVS
jgi:hypothetical protein